MQRNKLVADRLYFDRSVNLYFISPDGEGVLWYDTKTQVITEHGVGGPVFHVDELED